MKRVIIFLVLFSGFSALSAMDAAPPSITIEFSRNRASFTSDGAKPLTFLFSDVDIAENKIFIGNNLLIDSDTLLLESGSFPLSSFTVNEVSPTDGGYRVSLKPKEPGKSRRAQRSGDLFAAFDQLPVGKDEFVRGDVLAVGGNVVIDGEVNGNVISLFGDILLAPTAICQRAVLAIGGKIKKDRQSRVYGIYQATDSWQRKKFFARRDQHHVRKPVDFDLDGAYNRVDGVTLLGKVVFESEETFMPMFFFNYGYGFWSKRSKYQLGMEQRLFDRNQLKFGGSVYRQTRTQDDWISGQEENTIYSLFARHDFRDYYEGEGGELHAEQRLADIHTLRADYSFEELDYLPANRHLWSLFGGSRIFRDNFSSVDSTLRSRGISDYANDEAVLQLTYLFDTIEEVRGEAPRSGWLIGVHYEHSSPTIGSDFKFDRFMLEGRRYQPLTERQNLNLRLFYGEAHGDLPLHRYLYLGGIRTLRAYDIKEFYGTRATMVNCEYVIDFPKADIGLIGLFDLGKTGLNSDFLTEGKWRGDVGIGFVFDEDFRLELTRQINGNTNDLQLSVLIGRSF